MASISASSQVDEPVVVTLATSTHPQKVIGRPSPSAPAVVQEFRGIPYGNIPGRWRHSTLRTSLPSDKFDATRNGPQCPQPPQFANSRTYQSHLDWPTDVEDSEFDCLNLLIVRPSPSALAKAGFDANNVKLPVYVNIHGGGFGFGASTDPMWDPTRLVARAVAERKPIIVVNANYRLGIFGFGISSDIIAAQQNDALKGGNFGIGDQRVALRWVSQNISAFGGDPTRVTIAGQSAGGISVQLHVLEAKFGNQPPLFRRAIQQSGGLGTLGPSTLEGLDEKWEKLYNELGIAAKAEQEKTEALLALSDSELLAVCHKLGWITFPPAKDDLTIRDRVGGRWSVHLGQAESPISQEGSTRKEPIVVFAGDCEAEGPDVQHIKSFTQLETVISSIEPAVPSYATEDILRAYDITPTLPLPDFHQRLRKFTTDSQFGYPVEAAREEFLSTAADQIHPLDGSPAFPTEVRAFRIKFGNPFPGVNYNIAHHCVDLLYIYDCFYADMAETDRIEESTKPRPEGWTSNVSLVSAVQQAWINFIVDDVVDGAEDVATVYEVDRKVYQKNVKEDKEWASMIARFTVLGRHWEDAQLIKDAIRASS